MNKSFTGAVRRQNETKYDLTSPTESSLVFCLSSDYKYPVMNINYAGIYLTVKRTNQLYISQSPTVKVMEIMELVDTFLFFDQKERNFNFLGLLDDKVRPNMTF